MFSHSLFFFLNHLFLLSTHTAARLFSSPCSIPSSWSPSSPLQMTAHSPMTAPGHSVIPCVCVCCCICMTVLVCMHTNAHVASQLPVWVTDLEFFYWIYLGSFPVMCVCMCAYLCVFFYFISKSSFRLCGCSCACMCVFCCAVRQISHR